MTELTVEDSPATGSKAPAPESVAPAPDLVAAAPDSKSSKAAGSKAPAPESVAPAPDLVAAAPDSKSSKAAGSISPHLVAEDLIKEKSLTAISGSEAAAQDSVTEHSKSDSKPELKSDLNSNNEHKFIEEEDIHENYKESTGKCVYKLEDLEGDQQSMMSYKFLDSTLCSDLCDDIDECVAFNKLIENDKSLTCHIHVNSSISSSKLQNFKNQEISDETKSSDLNLNSDEWDSNKIIGDGNSEDKCYIKKKKLSKPVKESTNSNTTFSLDILNNYTNKNVGSCYKQNDNNTKTIKQRVLENMTGIDCLKKCNELSNCVSVSSSEVDGKCILYLNNENKSLDKNKLVDENISEIDNTELGKNSSSYQCYTKNIKLYYPNPAIEVQKIVDKYEPVLKNIKVGRITLADILDTNLISELRQSDDSSFKQNNVDLCQFMNNDNDVSSIIEKQKNLKKNSFIDNFKKYKDDYDNLKKDLDIIHNIITNQQCPIDEVYDKDKNKCVPIKACQLCPNLEKCNTKL